MDLSEKRKTLAALQTPECGFRELPGGVWTWTCEQEPLSAAVQAPQGSAFALSAIMGLPFVRLRAALPEEFFAGSVGQALGRRAGLSAQGLQDARDDNIAAMLQLSAALPCFGTRPAPQIPAFESSKSWQEDAAPRGKAAQLAKSKSAAVGGREAASAPREQRIGKHMPRNSMDLADTQPTPSRLVGTALALAFCSNAKTLSVVELARRTAAASSFFAGVTMPGTVHGFDSLLSIFLVMLSSGNLSGREDWLSKARLWRLILLQQADGGWRQSDSLAFAIEAHAGKKPAHVPKRSKLLDIINMFSGDAELDDLIDEVLTDSDSGSEGDDAEAERNGKASSGKLLSDDPLAFSAAAIRRRLPRALSKANARYEAYVAAEAERAARERDERAALRAEAAARRAEALAAAVQPQPQPSLGDVLSFLVEPFLPVTRPVAHISGALQPWRGVLSDSSAGESDGGSRLVAARSKTRHVTKELAIAIPPQRIPVERIWSTALALSVLEDADSSWLAEYEGATERTIVDMGRAFLRAQSRDSRRVRFLLKRGVLEQAASKARTEWRRIQTAHISQLRDLDVINAFTALTHIQRASARIVRSCMIDHSTFAVFLDTAGYLARWQRFMILITLVLSTLLTSIWFYCAWLHAQPIVAPALAHDILPARRLSRCHVLRRDPHDPGLRPRG